MYSSIVGFFLLVCGIWGLVLKSAHSPKRRDASFMQIYFGDRNEFFLLVCEIYERCFGGLVGISSIIFSFVVECCGLQRNNSQKFGV